MIRYRQWPTCRRFHADSVSRVRALVGPVGSGKTTAFVQEVFRRSCQQAPCQHGPLQGVRPTAWALIRNTYPELRSTTIRTWQQWVPSRICPIVYSSPIEGRMSFPLTDGTRVESTIWFLSLDRPADLEKIVSMEVTGAGWNEGRFSPWELVVPAIRRCGRYPKMTDVAPTWYGFFMDTNPPPMDHWIYTVMEVKRPKGWTLYRQPGGIIRDAQGRWAPNPLAENIENLPGGYDYYMDLIEAADPGEVRVMAAGEYGYMFSGKGVYADIYHDHIHYDARLEAIPGLPLHLGWDFGYNYPACVVAQDSNGQLRVLREYLSSSKGIQQFVREDVLPGLANHFPNFQIGTSTGDPAGLQHKGTDGNQEITLLSRLIPTERAKTNLFTPRRDAVIERLTRTVGGQPGFLIGPGAPVLRKGFLGGYRFRRVQIGAQEGGMQPRYHPEPEKTEESHPHDALQYVCLRLGGEGQKPGGGEFFEQEENWEGFGF